MSNKLAQFQFAKGVSGNPKGRPPGTRSLLHKRFLTDLLQHWEQEGHKAIDLCFKEQPATYLKVVASLLPREDILKVGPLSELDENEFAEIEQAVIELRAKQKRDEHLLIEEKKVDPIAARTTEKITESD
jgi:hypothetical protein